MQLAVDWHWTCPAFGWLLLWCCSQTQKGCESSVDSGVTASVASTINRVLFTILASLRSYSELYGKHLMQNSDHLEKTIRDSDFCRWWVILKTCSVNFAPHVNELTLVIAIYVQEITLFSHCRDYTEREIIMLCTSQASFSKELRGQYQRQLWFSSHVFSLANSNYQLTRTGKLYLNSCLKEESSQRMTAIFGICHTQ